MAKKTRKPLRAPTLKEYVMVPITDPAEQAALDRRCEEAEKMFAARARRDYAKQKSRKGK